MTTDLMTLTSGVIRRRNIRDNWQGLGGHESLLSNTGGVPERFTVKWVKAFAAEPEDPHVGRKRTDPLRLCYDCPIST